MHTHLLSITVSEEHCVVRALGLFFYITSVCEEKSSSCQLIYIHKGHMPIFKCFMAINLTLQV